MRQWPLIKAAPTELAEANGMTPQHAVLNNQLGAARR
jgi:hypothetical protein